MRLYRILIAAGYISIFLLVLLAAYIFHNEQHTLELLEQKNNTTNGLRKSINRLNMQIAGLSFLGETVMEWTDSDKEEYHLQRMVIDSTLCSFRNVFRSEQKGIDSLRRILANKESQLNDLAALYLRQKTLHRQIADRVPAIARKSADEAARKPKRKGFLGLFGKKEDDTPTSATAMLHSLNSHVIAEQNLQDRLLSEQTDRLAGRNAMLNRQLQQLVRQIDGNVQEDLQRQEAETASERERIFMQIGGLAVFALALLLVLFFVIHRDASRIGQYKRRTAELIGKQQESLRQNEALIASRKKAVHTITHELRTPLNAIMGYTGLIEKEHDPEKTAKYMRNIRQSSDRMRRMLNTLLAFFRLDSGKEQPCLSPCRISILTQTLETEFAPAAMHKGLALEVENRADAFVITDKERILQIGNNLLSNAIKFTENGHVSLTTDFQDGNLVLTVEDTGTGMTAEEQQRVFGAFERLSNAATQDGFGLGLSIVRHIVKMLGGNIRLESEKGKGSRFIAEIPAQIIAETPMPDVESRARCAPMYRDVIAIDNDEVSLQMMKEMYIHEGVRCDICTNVAELVEMVRRKDYSLLLTDLNMPEINGFELLELLRSSNVGNSRTIPVVVTTGSGSCDAEELLAHGFSGSLFKPFSISELMEVTDRCAMKVEQSGRPDFSSLLSYGNEAAMLDKLTTETEKEMQALRDAKCRNDLEGLNALTHHLRSSWEILRADQPLKVLYRLLHGEGTPDNEALSHAVDGVLEKGAEIIRQSKEERRKYGQE